MSNNSVDYDKTKIYLLVQKIKEIGLDSRKLSEE